MALTCDEILTHVAVDKQRTSTRAPSVNKYVDGYHFEFDGGGSYAPTEAERAMIEDAIEGYLATVQSA